MENSLNFDRTSFATLTTYSNKVNGIVNFEVPPIQPCKPRDSVVPPSFTPLLWSSASLVTKCSLWHWNTTLASIPWLQHGLLSVQRNGLETRVGSPLKTYRPAVWPLKLSDLTEADVWISLLSMPAAISSIFTSAYISSSAANGERRHWEQ